MFGPCQKAANILSVAGNDECTNRNDANDLPGRATTEPDSQWNKQHGNDGRD
jgi:hypothetical protein